MSGVKGAGRGIPRQRTTGRDALEQAIARGLPNQRIMAEFRLTERQLNRVMDEMVGIADDESPVADENVR